MSDSIPPSGTTTPAKTSRRAKDKKDTAKKSDRRSEKASDIPTTIFPISSTTRLIKAVTLEHVPLLTEVRVAISRYTFAFFVVLLSVANKHRLKRGGKNIAPYDLLFALNQIGMHTFIPEALHVTAILQQRVEQRSERAKQIRHNKKQQQAEESSIDSGNTQDPSLGDSTLEVSHGVKRRIDRVDMSEPME